MFAPNKQPELCLLSPPSGSSFPSTITASSGVSGKSFTSSHKRSRATCTEVLVLQQVTLKETPWSSGGCSPSTLQGYSETAGENNQNRSCPTLMSRRDDCSGFDNTQQQHYRPFPCSRTPNRQRGTPGQLRWDCSPGVFSSRPRDPHIKTCPTF